MVRNQKKKVPTVPSASVNERCSFWICVAHGMVGSTSRAFLQSIFSHDVMSSSSRAPSALKSSNLPA